MNPGRRLSVLSVSPSDAGGGAERMALALHEAYLERGLESWAALGRKTKHLPGMLQIPNDEARSAWARALLRPAWRLDPGDGTRGPIARVASRALRTIAEPARYARVLAGHEDFNFPATARLLELPPHRPDILHLHNLHGSYFDIRALPALTAKVPTIATLHDAWLLAGHCAHPLDCARWRTGCGECPYLDLYVPLRRDASRSNRALKRDAVAQSRLRIATPSHWLMRTVKSSDIAEHLIETRVIPNGVDTSVFRPGERGSSRAQLGLPQDRGILLVAAWAAETNPFKDFATLVAALPAVAKNHPDTLLVVAGARGPTERTGGVETLAIPFVTDASRMAEYYRAADVYVHPARAENLPLGVLEAMACGTPVVATDVGGIPEAIEDGESGLLVPAADPEAMAVAISRLLGDEPLRRALGEAGATRAAAEFTFERQVEAYVDWYAEIVG